MKLKNIRKGIALFNDTVYVRSDPIPGGMSTIWKVRNLDWRINMAMKIPKLDGMPDPDAEKLREDFIRECELWTDLGIYPYIVPCYFVAKEDDVIAAFSEWMKCGSLADKIKDGSLYEGTYEESIKRILKIAAEILMGLKYAHANGVIHKDIKPSNILFSDDGAARITDFGTSASSAAGFSKPYCSPEQAAGKELTEKTDIFSWALTLLEMLTGERCWEEGDKLCNSRYLDEILGKSRLELPHHLDNVIRECLFENPDERPDAGNVAAILRGMFADLVMGEVAKDDKFSENISLCRSALKSIIYEEFDEDFTISGYNDYTTVLSKIYGCMEKYMGRKYFFDSSDVKKSAAYYNNKALSCVVLSKEEEAKNLWCDALALYPDSHECVYNYYTFLWERGMTYDTTLKRELSSISKYDDFYRGEFDKVFGEDYGEGIKIEHRGRKIDSSYRFVMGFNENCTDLLLLFTDKNDPNYAYLERYDLNSGNLIESTSDKDTVEKARSVIENLNCKETERFKIDDGFYETTVTDRKTNRIMNTLPDAEEYIFSKSGRMYAVCSPSKQHTVDDEYVIKITVYSTRCADYSFCPKFSKSTPLNVLLLQASRYEEDKAKFEEALAAEDIFGCINALNGMGCTPDNIRNSEYIALKRQFISEHYDELRLSEPTAVKIISCFKINPDDKTCGCFSPDEKYLVFAINDTVRLIDTSNGEVISEAVIESPPYIIPLLYDLESVSMAFAGNADRVCITQIFGTGIPEPEEPEENNVTFSIKGGTLTPIPDNTDDRPNDLWKNRFCNPDLRESLQSYNILTVSPTALIVAAERADTDEPTLNICYIDYKLGTGADGDKTENAAPDSADMTEEENPDNKPSENVLKQVDNKNDEDEPPISGMSKDNEFLIDSLPKRYQYYLRVLSGHIIKNPAFIFQENARLVKNIYDMGLTKCADPEDPDVSRMLRCNEEENDEWRYKVREQSELWDQKPDKDFLSLYIDSILKKRRKENIQQKPTEIPDIDFVHPSAAEQRKKDLPNLVNRIDYMRQKLLECVKGQDHAVHAFADGLFNAEVIAAADEKRFRPKAIFTFAGPPGVGKTFLAEKAAEFMGDEFFDGVKRFDMSEFSGYQSHEQLIGCAYMYKSATEGILTSYVRKHPRSILVFDELEKAHPNTIQLFYQILDSGRLTDAYLESGRAAVESGNDRDMSTALKQKFMELDPVISFKDTIIIFTTNAGHSLYEGDDAVSGEQVTMQTIISALRSDISPITGAPYFPEAIISRLATGYPILFNRLDPHDLEQISENEFNRCSALVKKQYAIDVKAEDSKVILSLLFANGGRTDARRLRAQTELFFKNELHKIFSLMNDDIPSINSVLFRVETKTMDEEISALFTSESKPKILLYADGYSEVILKNTAGEAADYYAADSIEKAIDIMAKTDIDFALIDPALSGYEDENYDSRTVYASITAHRWDEGRKLFKALKEKFPEMPVFLLEGSKKELDPRLLTSFIRAGAEGKISIYSYDERDKISEIITSIAKSLYMRRKASEIASRHKILSFETAPQNNGGEIVVVLRNFKLIRAVEADDAEDILDSSEIPEICFDDVIGAREAKESLAYFVKYFKNPKEFIAKGLSLPKGVLLHGKPGTGKTMLAKAMAGESGASFFPAVGSMFLDGKNSGPEGMRTLFKKARRYAPSIIFIDEVDTIAKQRTGSVNSKYEEAILNTLLAEMDGFASDPRKPVFVMAATNYEVEQGKGIGTLDEAFMRRFDRKILVTLPDLEDRIKFLNMCIEKIELHRVTEDGIRAVAARSFGMSPAILVNVLNTAKQLAFDAAKPVDDSHLLEALERVRFGEKKDFDVKYLESTAYHEAGHAVMYYLEGNIPKYITIEGRSHFGGYMELSEEMEKKPYSSKNELIGDIRMTLAGRAAEIVKYGKEDGLSTGSSSDLRSATNSAVYMITAYGMDEKIGILSIDYTTAIGMPEVRKRANEILLTELNYTVKTLAENRSLLEAAASALLDKNKLTGEEFKKLCDEVMSVK